MEPFDKVNGYTLALNWTFYNDLGEFNQMLVFLWNFKVVLDHKLIGSWSLRSAVPRWLWFLDLTLQYNMAEPAYQ